MSGAVECDIYLHIYASVPKKRDRKRLGKRTQLGCPVV